MNNTYNNKRAIHRDRLFLAILLALSLSMAAAQLPSEMRECAALQNDRERLSCYDSLAGRTAPPPATGAEVMSPQVSETLTNEQNNRGGIKEKPPIYSRLGRHWELEQEEKRGLYNFRPHRENYVIGTYNPSPHNEPYRPYQFLAPESSELSRAELAFQLGFKLKAVENVAGTPMDVWFGYTQHSFWQVTNRDASSPFRETNYQPELMVVYPLNQEILGMRLRFLNAGLVHQSNGQGGTLSRSWNRVYLQAGLEGENFTLLPRIWHRISEDADEDDNPDITHYLGHGDLMATYYRDGHEMSVLARYNFGSGKGSARLGWAFPLTSKLKGYMQYFSGYGYSLIDYNDYQRVFGLGLQVSY